MWYNMGMKKSGIIYPDPQKNEPVLEPNSTAGSVVDGFGLEDKDQLQNEKSNNIDFGVNYGVEGKLAKNELETASASESDLVNMNQMAADSENSLTNSEDNDNSKNNENIYQEDITNNFATNNFSMDHSDFGVRTFRDIKRQEDSTKKVLESLKKSPYGSSSDTSRKFSSGNEFDSGNNGDEYKDSARDLLTVNQISSKGHSSANKDSSGNSGSGDKSRQDKGDTARDLLTVSQIKTRKSGNNMDASKMIGKLSERKNRVRKRRVEKEEKSESPLLNLMFVFEIFRWFSGSDIIVRFIIGAIAGIAGFGIIFTSMGLLDNL